MHFGVSVVGIAAVRKLTARLAVQVTSVVPSKSNPTRGVVGTDVSVVNQVRQRLLCAIFAHFCHFCAILY